MENKYYEMNIAGCIRRLPRIRITDSMEIASFVLLGDAELVVKAAAELVKEMGFGSIAVYERRQPRLIRL